MIFKPDNTKLWDTFILPHENKFYLFYLQSIADYWDGYGLAVSDDLLHWEDIGTILEMGHSSGTGMVYRAAGKWILSNCSMTPGKRNHIRFAQSDDLIHWEMLPEEYDLYPDPKWYDAAFPGLTSSRFGDMWVEQIGDGSYVGFLTASLVDGPAGVNGVVGMAKSMDGLHWRAVPPASMPCGMAWAEFGAHVAFSNRHYMLIGVSSGLGNRFDSVYNPTGKSGGMYVMMSDNLEGPYKLIEGDALLLGCRNAPANWAYIPAYYLRTFRLDGQVLAHHHWLPRENFIDAWLSTCKVLNEDYPGKLSLYWWEGNEKLKGPMIFNIADKHPVILPQSNKLPTGKWMYCNEGIVLESESSALVYCPTEDISGGIIVEATLKIIGKGAGGLYWGNEAISPGFDHAGVAILCNTRGLVEFGSIKSCVCSPAFMAENNVKWPVIQNKKMRIRILLKGEFAEVYIDGKLVQCYGFNKPVIHNIGVFAEQCLVEVEMLKAYAFT